MAGGQRLTACALFCHYSCYFAIIRPLRVLRKSACVLRERRTPPQLRVRARSLPVPSGSTATGGGGAFAPPGASESIAESTQPTVPSPPHTSTRRPATRLYSDSLRARRCCTSIIFLHSVDCTFQILEV